MKNSTESFKLNQHLTNLMPQSNVIAYDRKFIESLTEYINKGVIQDLQDTEILKKTIESISDPDISVDGLKENLKHILPSFAKNIKIKKLKEHFKENDIDIREEGLIDRLLKNYIDLNLQEISTSGQLIEALQDGEKNKKPEIKLSNSQKSIAIYVLVLLSLLD